MGVLNTDFVWLVCGLITLNFICMAAIRSEERFWLAQLSTWIILLGILLFRNSLNRDQVQLKQIVYNAQTSAEDESNRVATLELEQARDRRKMENLALVRLLGIQTIICAAGQALGYRITANRRYRSGTVSFFLLSVAYFIFEISRLFS